jgi:hypothetical protein
MRILSLFRMSSVVATAGVALAVSGCDADQATSKTETGVSRAPEAIKDLARDLKPPVIIKPDNPPAGVPDPGNGQSNPR